MGNERGGLGNERGGLGNERATFENGSPACLEGFPGTIWRENTGNKIEPPCVPLCPGEGKGAGTAIRSSWGLLGVSTGLPAVDGRVIFIRMLELF